MTGLEIIVGALITYVEPGTTTPLCGTVTAFESGAGGVPMLWAVQRGESRAFRAPVIEVKPGCVAVKAPAAAPSPPVPASGPRAS